MADTKAADVTVFLNRGKRHFDLAPGSDGKPRRHAPGATMAYSAEEAKQHEGYPDLIDISKITNQVGMKEVRAENAKLLDENAKLRAQLAALEPKGKRAVKEEKREEVNA